MKVAPIKTNTFSTLEKLVSYYFLLITASSVRFFCVLMLGNRFLLIPISLSYFDFGGFCSWLWVIGPPPCVSGRLTGARRRYTGEAGGAEGRGNAAVYRAVWAEPG